MTDIYIDPQWGGNKSGTVPEPYDDFPGSLSSNNNYWLKYGSELHRTTQVNFANLQNVTIGAYYVVDGVAYYDHKAGLEKPKWSCHSTITSIDNWSQIETNVWEHNDQSGVQKHNAVLGLGRIGDMNSPSWTERVNYYGIGTNETGFTTYGQWDREEAAGSPKFAIYSPQNPYLEFGTIYYSSAILNPIIRISCSSSNSENITVENIHFRQGVTGLRIFNNTIQSENITVTNCIFDHCYDGLKMHQGTSGTTVNTRIVNNLFNECGNTGIWLGSGTNNGDYIAGNTILNTGRSSCIGGIYGNINEDRTGAVNYTIIENNYVDTVFGVTAMWNYEQRCIYLERGSNHAIVRNNICKKAHNAGLHSNAGTGPNYFLNNLVIDCGLGMEDSDAADQGATENYYIGNTCVDCEGFGFTIGRSTASTDSGKVVLSNNVFVSKDGAGVAAVNLGTKPDDLGLLETPDNCIAHGYNELVTRAGSTSGLQTTPGGNFVSADPLLSDINYAPSPGSPCINAGAPPLHPYDVYSKLNYGNHIGAVWPSINTNKKRRKL